MLYSPTRGPTRQRGRRAITIAQDRPVEGDLLLTLASLVQRNRLAMVVLAAQLGQAGSRARDAAAASSAARWLARNVGALRLFLATLQLPCFSAQDAGYRLITEGREATRRRRRAPRLLRCRLDHHHLARPDAATVQARHWPPSVLAVY